jgi:hypothetical protein
VTVGVRRLFRCHPESSGSKPPGPTAILEGGPRPPQRPESATMSTRKLIITALLTGLVILIAGAVQLVMIMS